MPLNYYIGQELTLLPSLSLSFQALGHGFLKGARKAIMKTKLSSHGTACVFWFYLRNKNYGCNTANIREQIGNKLARLQKKTGMAWMRLQWKTTKAT